MADTPKPTGFPLRPGIPVKSLRGWEPDDKLTGHCHALLGLTPDGAFRVDDAYRSPEGTDARSPNRPAL